MRINISLVDPLPNPSPCRFLLSLIYSQNFYTLNVLNYYKYILKPNKYFKNLKKESVKNFPREIKRERDIEIFLIRKR